MKRCLVVFLCIAIFMSFTLPALAIKSVPAKSIRLDKGSINMVVGKTYNLKITLAPANTTQKLLKFATSNKNVATIDSKGKIKALKEGKAVITVISSANKKIYANCNVTIVSNAFKPDISKQVTVRIYQYGDQPKDFATINAELNKKTEKDLNCNVNFTFITWADFATKYALALTSGEKYDLINTSGWSGYFSYAKKGAFQPLNDLLPKYAPETYQNIPRESWNVATVNGNIYCVPTEFRNINNSGALYREDLRKKYNLPEISSVETMEAYLDGIKKYEPSMIPVDLGGSEAASVISFLLGKNRVVDAGNAFLTYTDANPRKLTVTWELPEYTQAVNIMKRWADKGFWPNSALSNKNSSDSALKAGKGALYISANAGKAKVLVESLRVSNPTWEFKFFPYESVTKIAKKSSPLENGLAVPKAAGNVERALMFVEKLHTDRTYYDLTWYGIKDKHYNLTAKGELDLTGIDSTKVGFSPEAMSPWCWNNDKFVRNMKDAWPGYDEVQKSLAPYVTPNLTDALVLNYNPLKAEVAAIKQVVAQYKTPMDAGLLPDVDGSIKTLKEKAKVAGLDFYKMEIQKQWDVYLNIKGVK